MREEELEIAIKVVIVRWKLQLSWVEQVDNRVLTRLQAFWFELLLIGNKLFSCWIPYRQVWTRILWFNYRFQQVFNRFLSTGWKWRRWEKQHDSEILQGNLHERLQKDDWRGLPRANDWVSCHQAPDSFLHSLVLLHPVSTVKMFE
jgi:hypothetical protein